jgi:hypothetical protein
MADFGLTASTYSDQTTLSELGVLVPALFSGRQNTCVSGLHAQVMESDRVAFGPISCL